MNNLRCFYLSNKLAAIVLVCVGMFSCNRDISKAELQHFGYNCTDLDSLKSFIIQNEKDIPNQFGRVVYYNLKQKNFPKRSDSFMLWAHDYFKQIKSEPKQMNMQLDIAYRDIYSQELLRLHLDTIENSSYFKSNSDTVLILNYLNLLGQYHYLGQRFTDAATAFKQGYQLVLRFNLDVEIERFANNCGAVYYELKQEETAINYFLRAYEYLQKRKGKNPVLNNNIAAILISQNKLKEAERYFLDCSDELKVKNTSYQGQLIKLNYARLLISMNKRKEAKLLMSELQYDSLMPVFHDDFLVNYIKLKQTEGTQAFSDFVSHFKSELYQNRYQILSKNNIDWAKTIYTYPSLLEVLNFKESDIDSIGDYFLFEGNASKLYQILAQKALRSGATREVTQFLEKSYSYSLRFNRFSDSLNSMDINEKMQFQNFVKEFDEIQKINIQQRKTILYQQILVALIVLLVLALLGILIFRNKLQREQRNLMKMELELKVTETERFKLEGRLQSKMNAISALVVKKANEISERLQQGNFNKDPEIIQIRQDLDALISIDFKDDFERNALLEKWNAPNVIIAEVFGELSQTQKDILVLSIEGIKAKEISNMLNMSYSHIRNTRSHLLKKLQAHGFEDFTQLKGIS